MVFVWRLRGNIIRIAPCWVVWHNVHSQQHTYVSSSYRSSRLGLSHWDPYAVHRGGCLELYYCNMVEWSWCDSSLIWRPTGFLQCFDTVGLVIWPVKIVPEMTYNVSSGMLSLYTTTTGWHKSGRHIKDSFIASPTLVIRIRYLDWLVDSCRGHSLWIFRYSHYYKKSDVVIFIAYLIITDLCWVQQCTGDEAFATRQGYLLCMAGPSATAQVSLDHFRTLSLHKHA